MPDPVHPTASAWIATLAAALSVEMDAQRAAHEQRQALPWSAQVAVGAAWPALRVEAVEPQRGRLLLRLRLSGGLLHDGMQRADPVEWGPQGGGGPWVRAEVVDVYPQVAELLLPWGAQGPVEGAQVLVRKGLDLRPLQRARELLPRALRVGGPLLALLTDPAAVQRPPAPVGPPPARPEGARLNEAQRRALEAILDDEPLSLIHGPPGTGKTTALVAGLRARVARGEQVLALADSNAAVDHLAICAAAAGLRVLRLARPWRVSPAARGLCLDSQVERSSAGMALSALDKELDRAARGGARGRELAALHAERRALAARAEADVIAGAQVIALTLGTLAMQAEALPKVKVAVVDEATQALEPAIYGLIPLAEKLVLVGDPCQLGPVVLGPPAPLQTSVMERLLAADPAGLGARTPMLEVQHRMAAPIHRLVQPVYGPAYRPHPAVADQPVGPLLPPDRAAPGWLLPQAIFVDTAGAGMDEERDPLTSSLFNRGELRLVRLAAEALRAAGLPAERLAVIAPYSAQVQRLRGLPALGGVEVDTVNAFQGREIDVLIVSFVRSNPDGQLGFVADPRRLTVALSRPRRGLVLIGDAATLGGHPRFAGLLDLLAAAPGALQSAWDPPWDAAVEG
ncbi:MAG: hypothetical protein RL071_4693 [Pseudomonadota bacterium]